MQVYKCMARCRSHAFSNSHRGFDIDEHFEKLAETYEELAIYVKVPRRLCILKVGSRDPDVEEGQVAIWDDSLATKLQENKNLHILVRTPHLSCMVISRIRPMTASLFSGQPFILVEESAF